MKRLLFGTIVLAFIIVGLAAAAHGNPAARVRGAICLAHAYPLNPSGGQLLFKGTFACDRNMPGIAVKVTPQRRQPGGPWVNLPFAQAVCGGCSSRTAKTTITYDCRKDYTNFVDGSGTDSTHSVRDTDSVYKNHTC